MISDSIPLIFNSVKDPPVSAHMLPQTKKSGNGMILIQNVQNPGCYFGMWTIIKAEEYFSLIIRNMPDDVRKNGLNEYWNAMHMCNFQLQFIELYKLLNIRDWVVT